MAEAGQKSKISQSPDLSDERLCRLIRASDEQAFKQLYYRYHAPLFKFIWRRVEDTDTGKELTQTLFIRLWNGRQRLDEHQSLKAYLYKIATNLIIDHFRQKGQVRHKALSELEIEPSEEMDKSFELEDLLDRAIAGLPEPVRTVFKLSRFKNIRNRDIAKELGISVKTVESRMTKAFTILRDQVRPFLGLLLILRLFLKS